MRWKPHVRFGGRAEESEQPKGRNRASARSNHTHATLLLMAGVPPKVVSERLGHATVSITLDLYSHVLDGLQAEAAEQIGAVVFGLDRSATTAESGTPWRPVTGDVSLKWHPDADVCRSEFS